MDLKSYYKKIRDVEQTLDATFMVVVSIATSDGGKPGIKSEVTRAVAAKLIAEQRARVANEEETAAFFAGQEDTRREQEAKIAAQRMHIVVVPQNDSRAPKPSRATKE